MPVRVLRDPSRVAATLHPLRREVLGLLDEPGSATSLGRRLGLPRQRINHHLRALEEAGLVEVAETRPRRGLTERLYRRTSDVVLVDPAVVLAARDASGIAGVIGAAVDIADHATHVATAAGESGERVAAATVDTEVWVESPAALRALLDDLGELLARYDRPTADGALSMRVLSVALPQVDR